MKAAALLLITALLPAQQRRAITPSPANGWARLVVEDDGAEGVWIGDASGRSVPFLWESDAKWSAIPLQTLHALFGKDAKGHPTGAFTLRAPDGFSRGDREQVRLELSLEAPATPWTCRVEVARRSDSGAFITLEDESRFLYDFGADRRTASLTLPWDGDDYRITLIPVQGAAPRLMGVDASACTLPAELSADACVNLALGPPIRINGQMAVDAALPGPRRLTGVEVLLQAPVAPVHVSLSALRPAADGKGEEASLLGGAELWNLPALETRSTRITLDGTAGKVRIHLPDGVAATSAAAFIRHRRLFFPAEAGQAYFLHTGGLANPAPGSLGELPASSRAFYTGTGLSLGAAEADPQAVAAAADPAARLRRVLPWGVGLVILLLGFWGLRLLKAPQQD